MSTHPLFISAITLLFIRTVSGINQQGNSTRIPPCIPNETGTAGHRRWSFKTRTIQRLVLSLKSQILIFKFRSRKHIACRVEHLGILRHHDSRISFTNIPPYNRVRRPKPTTIALPWSKDGTVFSSLVTYNRIVHQVYGHALATRSNGTSFGRLAVQVAGSLVIGPQCVHGIQSCLGYVSRS